MYIKAFAESAGAVAFKMREIRVSNPVNDTIRDSQRERKCANYYAKHRSDLSSPLLLRLHSLNNIDEIVTSVENSTHR